MIGCEARINEVLNHDLLPAFAQSRMFLLQVGVECGYEEGLKRIKKGLRLDKVKAFAHAVKRMPFRYQVYWSYVIGFPWEEEREVLTSIDFAFDTARASGSQQPQINNFAPYPGTPMVAEPERFGLRPLGPQFYDDPLWFGDFLDYSQVAVANRSFIQRYLHDSHYGYPRHTRPKTLRLPSGLVLNQK